MLHHPTVDQLHQLRLTGMAKALVAANPSRPTSATLSFEERLGLLLVDSELAGARITPEHRPPETRQVKAGGNAGGCQFPPSAWPRQGLVRAPDDRTLGQRAPECADLRPDRRQQDLPCPRPPIRRAGRGIQPLRAFAAPLAGAGHRPELMAATPRRWRS